ncbi:MAG: DUF1674 domain-containing protein [Kordiimonadaceae bacterium]|nr:DUF1674 domain-containing protein [Kordiimonadaceae bacterium]MBT6330854.1 DUF1674 domain-containing protein [Kordiimonadaceae bacterium]MBT7581657.1 DUF1674 domain-containing protein [Kordiimonadaceae bacterium]
MNKDKVVPENTAKGPDQKKKAALPAKELGGRDGPDPVRYGDWENKGIASDF